MDVVLALDIGEKRIGVAIAEPPVFIAHPLVTLSNEDDAAGQLAKIISDRSVQTVVIGSPKNLSGEATKQTETIKQLSEQLNLPAAVKVVWQDEALTSVKAEEELEARGKPFEKGDIDALAATFILEDYLKEAR